MTWTCPTCSRDYPDSGIGLPGHWDADEMTHCRVCVDDGWVSIRLPFDEAERVMTALVVYANSEEYRKDNPEKAKSIRQTGRGIALQVGEDMRGDSA